jgi:hypothetical protein
MWSPFQGQTTGTNNERGKNTTRFLAVFSRFFQGCCKKYAFIVKSAPPEVLPNRDRILNLPPLVEISEQK